jgi:hypothetical protein
MNPAIKLIAGLAIVAIGAFTAFLIDKKCRVLRRYVGEPAWQEFDRLVEQALADPASYGRDLRDACVVGLLVRVVGGAHHGPYRSVLETHR